eukprot:g2728.t1
MKHPRVLLVLVLGTCEAQSCGREGKGSSGRQLNFFRRRYNLVPDTACECEEYCANSGTCEEWQWITQDNNVRRRRTGPCYLKAKTSDGVSSATQLPDAQYSVAGLRPACAAGRYRDYRWGCEDCWPGSFNDEETRTATTCKWCPKGRYSADHAATACELCPAGTYHDQTGGTEEESCKDCGEGYFSGDGAAACTPCAAGMWQDGDDEAACKPCPKGTFLDQEAQTSETACKSCPSGTFQSKVAQTTALACKDCPAGTYSGAERATAAGDCVKCPKGKYQDQVAQTSDTACKACSYGQYEGQAGRPACKDCGKGRYQDQLAQTAAAACKACAEGKYQEQVGQAIEEACKLCPAGMYGDQQARASAAQCKDCPQGTYGVAFRADTQNCAECPRGTFNDNLAQTDVSACKDCLRGLYGDQYGTTGLFDGNKGCKSCEAGRFGDQLGQTSFDASCKKCMIGFYAELVGQQACKACGRGLYMDEEVPQYLQHTACKSCTVGTYQNSTAQTNVSACLDCVVGLYGDVTAAAACKACAAGLYNDQVAQSAAGDCKSCAAGTFGDKAGLGAAGDCEVCATGLYNDQAGQDAASDCKACAAGKYNDQRAQDAEADCKDCAPGTYLEHSGQETVRACISCAAGTYNDLPAQRLSRACRACLAGKYSATNGATQCDVPPVGTFTEMAGSSAFQSCPAGTSSDESRRMCMDSGKHQAAAKATFCVACNVGKAGSDTRNKTSEASQSGKHQAAAKATFCVACNVGKAGSDNRNKTSEASHGIKIACPEGRLCRFLITRTTTVQTSEDDTLQVQITAQERCPVNTFAYKGTACVSCPHVKKKYPLADLTRVTYEMPQIIKVFRNRLPPDWWPRNLEEQENKAFMEYRSQRGNEWAVRDDWRDKNWKPFVATCDKFEKRFGFLFNSYKHKYFWFESVMSGWKLVMTTLIVFIADSDGGSGTTMKILYAMFAATCLMACVSFLQPFKDEDVLSVETMVNLEVLFVLFAALYLEESPRATIVAGLFLIALLLLPLVLVAVMLWRSVKDELGTRFTQGVMGAKDGDNSMRARATTAAAQRSSAEKMRMGQGGANAGQRPLGRNETFVQQNPLARFLRTMSGKFMPSHRAEQRAKNSERDGEREGAGSRQPRSSGPARGAVTGARRSSSADSYADAVVEETGKGHRATDSSASSGQGSSWRSSAPRSQMLSPLPATGAGGDDDINFEHYYGSTNEVAWGAAQGPRRTLSSEAHSSTASTVSVRTKDSSKAALVI